MFCGGTTKRYAAIHKVNQAISRYDVNSRDWEQKVVKGTVTLITDTVPTLSRGWATGAAFACMLLWCYALSAGSDALIKAYVIEGLYILGVRLWIWVALAAIIITCSPALVLWDVAHVSTECDVLVTSLNDKRLSSALDKTFDAIHAKVGKLESMLNRLNKVRACFLASCFHHVTLRLVNVRMHCTRRTEPRIGFCVVGHRNRQSLFP